MIKRNFKISSAFRKRSKSRSQFIINSVPIKMYKNGLNFVARFRSGGDWKTGLWTNRSFIRLSLICYRRHIDRSARVVLFLVETFTISKMTYGTYGFLRHFTSRRLGRWTVLLLIAYDVIACVVLRLSYSFWRNKPKARRFASSKITADDTRCTRAESARDGVRLKMRFPPRKYPTTDRSVRHRRRRRRRRRELLL